MGGRSAQRRATGGSDKPAAHSRPPRRKAGRKVREPPHRAAPETIQKMIADDPTTWTARRWAARCRRAGTECGQREERKGLFDAGEHMERACEACHQQYWYPPKEAPAWKKERGGHIDNDAESLRAHRRQAKRRRHHGSRWGEGEGARQSGHQDGDGSGVREAQRRQASRSGGRHRERRRQPGERLRQPAGIVSRLRRFRRNP